ncbi:glycosyltransferase family 8 protein [Marseilla massiliensis]|uniref:Glycosyltransferase family 8 protein n=1 Tax=Marseilla massiliensis TaxID=1841864 RepID=A0A938WRP4_9BACT|nr:glycosyltransferase family 8 protein [Marseilla massiliensis]MBM6662928.1 glycosyltransferase family 8 protein [Marseilla massiliensis]
MNIVLGTDDKYAMPCGVCLTSLFENNKKLSLNVYILTDGLSDKQRKKFEILSDKYKRSISIIDINETDISQLKVSQRFSRAIYYRFLIPKILNDEKYALYIDCDIIINGSLAVLESLNLDSYACAVVRDQMCDDIRLTNRIDIKTPYFNSGVILMNLDYWRKYDIAEKCINYIYNYPNLCLYPDQDALNKILSGKVLYLSVKYNYQEKFYEDKNKVFFSRTMWSEVDQWKNAPVIIHYTSYIKPWFKECVHPLKNIFVEYRNKSLWKGRAIKYYNLRKKIKEIKEIIVLLYRCLCR